VKTTFKLSLYWFFVMGALGVFFPFFSLFLKENAGLSGGQVGIVLAILPLTGIFVQPLFGQVADRSGKRTRLLALLALGTAFGYLLMPLPATFYGMLLATTVLALFSSSLIPMGVSVSMALLAEKGLPNFGRVRVFGTIGFLVTVVSTPIILEFLRTQVPSEMAIFGSSRTGLELIFIYAALLVSLAAMAAWLLPRGGSVSSRAAKREYRALLTHAPFLKVLMVVFLIFFFLQGPLNLFPILISERGGDTGTISHMWIFMLIPEIPLVAFANRAFGLLSLRWVIAIAALAGGIRSLVCALSPGLGPLYLAQMLHGIVVVGLFVGAPQYVERAVPENLRTTGQNLLSMLGASTGGIISSSLSGLLYESFGIEAPFLLGGIGLIALGLMVPNLLKQEHQTAAS
jgi:PPP family 3-phenylpropionic acid transporter